MTQIVAMNQQRRETKREQKKGVDAKSAGARWAAGPGVLIPVAGES